MTVNFWIAAALAASTGLAGCGAMPDSRYRSRFPAWPELRQAPGANATGAGVAPSSSTAEQACMAAGTEAGFEVQGVVGTRELMGPQASPNSRDVMLRVRRGGQTVDVRCNFAYDTGTARIMTL